MLQIASESNVSDDNLILSTSGTAILASSEVNNAEHALPERRSHFYDLENPSTYIITTSASSLILGYADLSIYAVVPFVYRSIANTMAATSTDQQRQYQQNPSTLLPSSIFSTPSFSSTLPIIDGRPNSASAANPRRSSAHRRSRFGSRNGSLQHKQEGRRRTRSVTSDMDDESDDGSLGNLSIENYTIDLAQLARRESGKIGVLGFDIKGGQGWEEEAAKSKDRDDDDEGDDTLAKYEVDLGPLGEKLSGLAVDGRQEERDEVASEADGPEDFTLNMGAWMRGMKQLVKEHDLPSDLNEQRKTDVERENHEDTLALLDDESILEPISTSTPAPKPPYGEEIAEQNLQGDQRPSIARGTTELLQDQAAEEVFQKISALQAEVEQMREAEERRRAAYKRLQAENRELRERQDNLPPASQDLVITRAEAERKRMASEERIETLEAGLKASHAAVRQLRQEMVEDEQMQNIRIEGLKEGMERLRADIDAKTLEVADLEQDAETQNEIIAHRDQLIARLTTDTELIREELERAQEEAKESRRISESVQEENEGLLSQQSQQNEEIAAAKAALQSRAMELQAAHDMIASLNAGPELESLSDREPEAMISESSHQAILDAVKQEHASALSALNQKFARQLQLFKQDRDTQASKHAAELAKAKETLPAPAAMETELRSAIRVLSSKLEKSNAATRTTQGELEAAQVELGQARRAAEMVRKDNDLVNQALETRFAEAVESREREWRRRVAVLFRERELMGKALMVGWGKEEVGAAVKGSDGGQGYRYRYKNR